VKTGDLVRYSTRAVHKRVAENYGVGVVLGNTSIQRPYEWGPRVLVLWLKKERKGLATRTQLEIVSESIR